MDSDAAPPHIPRAPDATVSRVSVAACLHGPLLGAVLAPGGCEGRNYASFDRCLRHFFVCRLLVTEVRPVGGPAYPADRGSNSIRRSTAPNSRRVRWAVSQQQPVIAGMLHQSARPSSPAAAAGWSAITCRFSSAAPAAARGSPDCKRSRSATAALRSTGSDGSSSASSSPPACLP